MDQQRESLPRCRADASPRHTSGVIDGAAEAVDLGQSPADIVVLSAADSELARAGRGL